MESHGASDRPASDGSSSSRCVRCGIHTPAGTAHCPGCLLRLGLEYDDADGDDTLDEFVSSFADPDLRRIGEYEILEEIGRGGMGVIYRARHEFTGAVVAVKCLLDYHADSRETVARFRREASAASMLKHPNILHVYEVGDTPEGLPFFAMQLVTGGTLHRRADQRAARPRQVRESVLLMAKVAEAVHFAHTQGILHRDLKPGNILLDEEGEPWVTDFGLAKWLHEPDGLTRTLLVFGTPGYIAPEQAHGPAAQLGPAADIYSIGAILFELLTGRPPFLGEHALAVLRQAAEEPAPRLRAIDPKLDRQLETICGRCLEREANARYRSAGDLAVDLRLWLAGRRIKARPVGQTKRASRWVLRNRALTAAVVVAALCGGFAAVRGMHSRALEREAHARLVSARSVVFLPVLDLDTALADDGLARALSGAFANSMGALGPVRVNTASQKEHAGSADAGKLRAAAQQSDSRTIVATSIRRTADGFRIWCRILDASSDDLIAVRSFAADSVANVIAGAAADFNRELYAFISRDEVTAEEVHAEPDPAIADEVTREWIEAARRLTFRYTPRELDHAISLFEKALEKQPGSYTAHAYLSSAYLARGHFYSDLEQVRRGTNAARRAVELAPHSREARRSLAGALYVQGELHEALEQALETAAVAGADDKLEQMIGMTLRSLGHPERGLAWFERAAQSASEPASAHVGLGDCWVRLGADEQAFRAFARAEELQPDLPLIQVAVGHLHLLRGEIDAARRTCAAAAGADLDERAQLHAQIEFYARNFAEAEELYSGLAQRHTGDGGSFYGAVNYDSAIGRSLQALGKSAEAQAVLRRCYDAQKAALQQQPTNPDTLYRLAAVEATLGMVEPALEHLQSAAATGWLPYRSLQLDPRFDNLRLDARFDKLLAETADRLLEKRQALDLR